MVMDSTGAGTAVMLGVAALLWFLYLVPTWLRRREYLASERTATRLQQTMLARAAAGETPDEVRLSETAREAARQERLLRAEQRRADAMALRQAAAVRRRVSEITAPVDAEVVRRQRMRRTRRLASALMLVATAAALVQFWLIATTGMSLGAWFVLIAAIAGGGVAIAVQRRLDQLAMPRMRTAARRRRAVTVPTYDVAERRVPWTPVEMPKPLYLSRPEAPPAPARPAGVEEALRAAVAASEENLRAAHSAPEIVPLTASRFSAMGRLDPSVTQEHDLDEALRRRRSAG